MTIDLDDIARRAALYAVDEYVRRHQNQSIVSKKDLASHLGWSISTINRKINEGMPKMGAKGERMRFKISEVERWLGDI